MSITAHSPSSPRDLCHDWRQELRKEGYRGGFSGELARRITASTDNSIYQVVPRWVATPAEGEDVARLVRANLRRQDPVSLVARGGGTGTNGQSLTEDLVVDFSRLRQIHWIDAERRRAWVDPGVVLDQLNAQAAEHGLFFAANVSTSSRATLGGMVATDAAGKGSRIYGRTHHHVTALETVLANGTEHTFRSVSLPQAAELSQKPVIGPIYQQLLDELRPRGRRIEQLWPRLERGLSGYNLLAAVSEPQQVNPIPLLCGSEGTLALVTGIEVSLEPLPKHRALVVAAFADFAVALEQAPGLLSCEPAAIEVMDEWVQSLGRQSPAWSAVEGLLPAADGSCLYIELVDDQVDQLGRRLRELETHLRANDRVRSFQTFRDPEQQKLLWRLRKDAVGLLARSRSQARPMAFVEDCAVPVERLASFIARFREILDDRGLQYGMYGHADAGCVHVRPALDLSAKPGVSELRRISDQVAELVQAHGGVLWGEHGRGFRGEYAQAALGVELYDLMLRVKAVFDPRGLLNPYKLYPAPSSPLPELPKLDQIPLRAQRDAEISVPLRDSYAPALRCNGNGLCHQVSAAEVMCPSFRATGEFEQSPKGRSDLLREWLRRESIGQPDAGLTEDLKRSLDGCLSCKACSSQCPAEVDIPEMKSRFLQRYYQDRRRPLRDLAMGRLESLGGVPARFPTVANRLLASFPVRRLASVAGLSDLPRFSNPGLGRRLRGQGDQLWKPSSLVESFRRRVPDRAVLLLADPFSAFFDAESLMATRSLMMHWGFSPYLIRPGVTGKFEHVKGYRRRFQKVAKELVAQLEPPAALGLPIVCLEPSITLLLQQEYKSLLGQKVPDVLPIHRWLSAQAPEGDTLMAVTLNAEEPRQKQRFQIFMHCSEQAADPTVGRQWQRIFAAWGYDLKVVSSGCCGMAGVFGHEAEHQQVSRRLFDLSWQRPLADNNRESLATGFSCRSQAHRFGSTRARHPIEALAELLVGRESETQPQGDSKNYR